MRLSNIYNDALFRLTTWLQACSPARSAGLLLLLTLVSTVLLSRVQILHQESSFFRASSTLYEQYRQYIGHYPAEQRDLLLIAQIDLKSQTALDTLKRFHLALERQDGVNSVLSILSASTTTDSGMQLPQSGLIGDRLVSHDRSATLLLVSIDDAHLSNSGMLASLVRSINQQAKNQELNVQLAGLPALRLALRKQVQTDIVKFTIAGFVIALILLWLALSHLSSALLVLLVPSLAVLMSLSVMALSGITLNVLTQVLIVFIVVIGASDALHLVHRIGRMRQSGLSRDDAIEKSVLNILPACLFTSLTTAAGFLSLCASQAVAVKQFGFSGFVGSLIVFFIVVLSLPLLAANCYRSHAELSEQSQANDASRPYTRWVSAVSQAQNTVIFLCVLLAAFMLWVAAHNHTVYEAGENLSEENSYSQAVSTLQGQFNASHTLVVKVQSVTGNHKRAQILRQVDSIQQRLNGSFDSQWLSIRDLIQAAPGAGVNSRLRMLPRQLQLRFWDPGTTQSAILTYTLNDATGESVLKTVARVQSVLDHSPPSEDWHYMVTGFPVIASDSSKTIMSDLLISLVSAIILISFLCFILFSQMNRVLLLVLPSILPVLCIAFMLALIGEPIRYAYILLFSVCFGLSVDSAIHVLMAYREGLASQRPVDAMGRALSVTIKPLLIASIIVSLGFALLLLSVSPTLSLVGGLGAISIAFALLCSLIIIPAFTDKHHW